MAVSEDGGEIITKCYSSISHPYFSITLPYFAIRQGYCTGTRAYPVAAERLAVRKCYAAEGYHQDSLDKKLTAIVICLKPSSSLPVRQESFDSSTHFTGL